VVVDYQDQTNEAGEVVRVPRSDAELESIRALVREAVGFSEKRGDSLSVTSVTFVPDTLDEDAIPFWTEPWFLELVKIAGGFVLALLVLLTVVRPGLQQLMPKPEPEPESELESGDEVPALTDESGGEDIGDETLALSQDGTPMSSLLGPKGPDQQQFDLEAVRELVREDPMRAAQVMKAWLAEDGN